MVEGAVLLPTAAAELEGGNADRKRGDARHDPGPRRPYLGHERRARKSVEVGITALCPDTALGRLDRRAVRHRLLGSLSPLLEADSEIGERQQARRGVEDE